MTQTRTDRQTDKHKQNVERGRNRKTESRPNGVTEASIARKTDRQTEKKIGKVDETDEREKEKEEKMRERFSKNPIGSL